MNACIFCKIVARAIPSDGIYEDEVSYAFADIRPNTLGHTLVVPKTHSTNIYTIPDATLQHLIGVAKKIAIAAKQSLKADGVNIGMNNDAAAGQLVFHTHLHVIPRYANDGLVHWKGTEMAPADIAKAAQMLRNTLETSG